MGKLVLIVFTLCLIIFFNNNFYISLNKNNFNIQKKIIVEGNLYLKEGNKMPKSTNKDKKKNNKEIGYKADIVVVKGKVKKENISPEINLIEINSKFYKTKSNTEGYFKIKLIPGRYTFFISENKNLYLNKFDGLGFFESLLVNKFNKKFDLIYDKNLLN